MVTENLKDVEAKIQAACDRAGRDRSEVTLIAVSKTKPVEMIKEAISLGVAKINVNTECQLAFAAATRTYVEAGKDLQGKGFDPRKLLAPGFDALKATVKEKMELFGSVNKA